MHKLLCHTEIYIFTEPENVCYFLSEMYFETSGTDVSIQHLKI